jgi:hypothetical protein
MTGSQVSGFGGNVLQTLRAEPQVSALSSTISMKKGKDNVPPQMRSQYAKAKEMQAMREQMVAASKPGADGLPVFNLFVRTKKANVRRAQDVQTGPRCSHEGPDSWNLTFCLGSGLILFKLA